MELSPRAPSPPRWTSSQRSAGHRKRLLRPHVSLLQRLPAGALKQARSSQPGHSHVLEARALTALRRGSARQLVTQPGLKAKCPAPTGQRGLWRPLRAGRAERAAPRSLSPEGCPRSSSAASAQTGSPNPNGAEQLHDPPQDTVRNSQSLCEMRPQKRSHLRHF